MVDPRQPRFGQAVTGSVLLGGFLLDRPEVFLILTLVLGAASLFGPRANPYAPLFRVYRRAARLGPPKELEEAGPPRFAAALGFAFVGAAAVLYYGLQAPLAAWGLGLLVSALALLAAASGLCFGCELFVITRRWLTRGRVPARVTAPAARGPFP